MSTSTITTVPSYDLRPGEARQFAELIRRSAAGYKRQPQVGPWTFRFVDRNPSGVETYHRIEVRRTNADDSVGWTDLGPFLEVAIAPLLRMLNSEVRQKAQDELRASVAIPWMKQPKDFRVKVEHPDMPGVKATLRMEPSNVCLATVTGIDKATEEIDSEVGDRLGAAWNLCAGLATSEMQVMAPGMVSDALVALRAIVADPSRAGEIAQAALLAAGTPSQAAPDRADMSLASQSVSRLGRESVAVQVDPLVESGYVRETPR